MTTPKALIQDQLTAQLFEHTLNGLKPQTVIARLEERIIITVEPGVSVTVTTSPGRPEAHLHSLTKEKDGTLTPAHSWAPSPPRHLKLTLPNPNLGPGPKPERVLHLRDAYQFDTTKVLRELVSEAVPGGLNSSGIATYIPIRKWSRNLPEPQRAQVFGDHIHLHLQQAVKELLDPDAWTLAQDINGETTIERYNRTVINRDPLLEIATTNPGAIGWTISDHALNERVHNHPGTIISALRPRLEAMGVHKSHWKTVSKIPPQSMALITPPKMPRYLAAAILNSCGAANAVPTPKTMKQATAMAQHVRNLSPHVHSPRKNDPERQQQAMETLSRAIRLLLAAGENNTSKRELYEICDYVANRINQRQDINNTNLTGLTRASHRWHQHMTQARMAQQIQDKLDQANGWVQAWNSLIGHTTLQTPDGQTITAVPLTDSLALLTEGGTMRHCVGTYDNPCIRGNSRIFSLRSETHTLATTQLTLSGGRWTASQTRGPHNHQAAKDIQQLAKDLAALYQTAWAAHRATNPHQSFKIHPETGESKPGSFAP